MTDLPAERLPDQPPGVDPGPVDAPTDLQLMERAGRGDELALGALYDRYGGLVFALVLRLVGDRGVAEEVLQDVFLRCWTGADRYDAARGAVPAWLFGVARNRAIDALRSRQHQARLRERESLDAEPSVREPSQPDSGDEIILRQAVSGALGALSPVQREALQLAYFGGLTQAENARSLGEPLGTVKTRMRDGLRRLREILAPVIQTDVGGREGRS